MEAPQPRLWPWHAGVAAATVVGLSAGVCAWWFGRDLLPYIQDPVMRPWPLIGWAGFLGVLGAALVGVLELGVRREGAMRRLPILLALTLGTLAGAPGLWAWCAAVPHRLGDGAWPEWITSSKPPEPFWAATVLGVVALLSVAGWIALALGWRRLRAAELPPTPRWLRWGGWNAAAIALVCAWSFVDPPAPTSADSDVVVGGRTVAEWFADLAHPHSRAAAMDALEALGVEAVPVWHEVLDTGQDANADARAELLVALRDLTGGDWFPGVPELDDIARGYLSIEGPDTWASLAWGALVQLPADDPAVMRAALTGSVTHRWFGNGASRAVLLGAGDGLGPLLAEFVPEDPGDEDDVPFAALRIAVRRPGCRTAVLPVVQRLIGCDDEAVAMEAASLLPELGEAGRDLAHRRLARELVRPGDSRSEELICSLLEALARFDAADARDLVVAERVLNHVLSRSADDIEGEWMLVSALGLILPAKPGHPTGMKRLRALLEDPDALYWDSAVDLTSRLGAAGVAEVPRIRKAAGNPPSAEASTAICLRRLQNPQADALAARIAAGVAPFEAVVALMQHFDTDPGGCRWLLDAVLAATPPAHQDRGRLWRAGAFFNLIDTSHLAAVTADLRSTELRTRRAAAVALGRMPGDPGEMTARLRPLLQDPDETVQLAAAVAIARQTGSVEGLEERVRPLLEQRRFRDERIEVLRELGMLGPVGRPLMPLLGREVQWGLLGGTFELTVLSVLKDPTPAGDEQYQYWLIISD